MSCFHPLKAFWRSASRDAITFDATKSATKIPFQLPCGRCIGCRMEKARQWGLRCMNEAKCWPSNYYVTMTYNSEYMPPGGSVSLRDVQLFMKRLRKHFNSNKDNPVRFFLGAEYGEDNRRPHYHALLFNVQFDDLRLHGYNGRGEPLYTSATMSRLWGDDMGTFGFVTLGAVTFESAVYCAKYALKQIKLSEHSTEAARQEWEKRYVVYDADGIVYERDREFAVMSRRPGIGAPYYEKYGQEIRNHDNMVVNGRTVRPPRYYDTKSDAIDPDRFAAVKKDRKRLAVLSKPDNTPERLEVKEKLAEIAASKQERKL
nr:MAG: replication initiator protein [Microvirus sp.]